MINSRDIKELDPFVRELAEDHVALCRQRGIELLITSTYRDAESQALMYGVGRTINLGSKIITNAKPWFSWHNYRCAYDVVPLVLGKCDWESRNPVTKLLTPTWEMVVDLGREAGLESASDWKGTFKEDAHFQVTPMINGLKMSIDEARAIFERDRTLFKRHHELIAKVESLDESHIVDSIERKDG